MRPRILRRAGAGVAAGIAALGVLVVAGSASTRSSASVDFPPAAISRLPGRIAYSTTSGDIWVMNADGTCRHQVTVSGPHGDYDPSWSPDGRRLVFSSDRGRSHHDATRAGLDSMFVIDVDGSHEREIEPRSGAAFPAWSSHGNLIAFSGLRATGQDTALYLVNPDGTGVHDLGLPGDLAEATWSPDGTKIAYASHSGDGAGMLIANADGSDPRQLTHSASRSDSPGAWSPDGKRLVFSSGVGAARELYVINVDGTGEHRISDWLGADNAEAWLPDGRIVFVHFNGDKPQAHFYVADADGSNIQSLPHLTAGDPISWLPRRARDNACGRRIKNPPSRKPTLKSLLEPLVQGPHSPPGAVAYVIDHGRRSAQAVGLARRENRTPMTEQTRFRIGSVTKTFTAVVVLQLVDEGKLRLDDRVGRWLPGLLASGDEITIRELLNHTSGVFDYVHDAQVRATWGTSSVPSPLRLVQIAASHGLDFPPGTKWEYSNTNYQLLGLVIQRVTGRPFVAELRNRILRPLELRATAFVPGRDIPGPHANAYYIYTNGHAPINETRTTFGEWADGAIVSDASDVAKFYSALLRGKLMSPALLAQMKVTVATNGIPDGDSGLGIFHWTNPCGRPWGHSGGTAGFLTKVAASANGQRVVVLATNGLVDEGPITQPLLDAAANTAFCSRIARPG